MRTKVFLALGLLFAILTDSWSQAAVTLGEQVMTEAELTSGESYVLQSMANGTPYIVDAGTYYSVPNSQNEATEACVYILSQHADGTWQVKSAYTGKCWGVPTYDAAIPPVDESEAGAWSLNFSGGLAYPACPDASGTVLGLDRSSQKLWGYSTGTKNTKQVRIYRLSEVGVAHGYQTTSRGAQKAVLLRLQTAPKTALTELCFEVELSEGTADELQSLTLYETSDTPEFYALTSPKAVATQEVTSSTATLSIANVKAGRHCYWLCGSVKDDATLGVVLDAALLKMTSVDGDGEHELLLGTAGNPPSAGARIMDVQSYPFLPTTGGSRHYRIPAMTVASDGSIVVACDKRYDSSSDIGGGHVIDIVSRRSTDGGRTWSKVVTIAKGDNSKDATCGYGDPSLTLGPDGRLYCLFAAGNIGYFYGLNRICMSTSDDNGVTWTKPVDLYETGRITDHTQYGLYDYFVTSGRGLCTTDGVLMYLLPAQPYTNRDHSQHQSNSNDYVFYSTDNGGTWHIASNTAYSGGDEAKVVQKNNGQLLASVRQSGGRGFNTGRYTRQDDGTLKFTWNTQKQSTQITTGAPNNQDILYYSRSTDGEEDIVLHTMTTGAHENLNLYISLNAGSTWKKALTLQPGGARYVTMARLTNGDLALLYEDYSLGAGAVYPINFVTLTRDQLLELYTAVGGKPVAVRDIPADDPNHFPWSPDLASPSSASRRTTDSTILLDLSGRRVTRPTRGLYITPSRKLIISHH